MYLNLKGAIGAIGMLMGLSANGPTYPPCPFGHASYQHRLESLAKNGDSEMARSAARHAVRYAIVRYGIKDIVTDADIAKADGEMYDYLSWKLGNPAAVAAQWLTAGYQHFDHSADEAAAALLGYELPGPGAQVRFPKELTDWLKAQVDTLGSSDTSTVNLCGSGADSTIAGFACSVVMQLAIQAVQHSIDRIGISSAALMGQTSFDIKDSQIELMEYARRNPPATTASAAKSSGTIKQVPTVIKAPTPVIKVPTRVPATR